MAKRKRSGQRKGHARPKSGSNGCTPSLNEAHRVADYIVGTLLKETVPREVDPSAEPAKMSQQLADLDTEVVLATIRRTLSITIATLIPIEHFYRTLTGPGSGNSAEANWESLEQSAHNFVDVVGERYWGLPKSDLAEDRRRMQRRRASRRAGQLVLVESEQPQRTRWAEVVLPDDAELPMATKILEGTPALVREFEECIRDHLNATSEPIGPAVLLGQLVGLLAAAEILLSLQESDASAALCVRLATLSVEHDMAEWDNG